MSNVFDILSADHREMEQMLASLQGGPAQDNRAASLRPEARKQLTEKLVIESSKHEAAEEQYFWPIVRDRLPNGAKLADHAIAQETDAKNVLAWLEKLSPGQAEYEGLLSKYIPAAREHISYEEDVVWTPLQDVLTAAEAEELGQNIAIAKEIAPTRPHPHIPPQPGVQKTAGPAVAAADKVRDELSGRGD
ncbi:MAG TPA: hemerythrin domain-containing protein [Streptosporangiaceae bacterium]|jgi:hemerythrin-like domain-containing protein